MTLEEAKKILKKEGYDVEKVGRPSSPSTVFTAYESPEICEAMQVVCSAGYGISMVSSRFDDRKARLSLELAENSAPMPGPGEEQPKEGNPALKESASQFNDALLDEQAKEIESLRDKCKKYADILDSVGDKLRELKAENRRIKDSDLNLEGLIYATRELEEKNKKIEELTMENERLKDQVAVLYACKENNEKYNLKQIKRLGKEIARLNKIIHKKNLKIEELGKESSRHLEGKIKMFGENVDLEQMLKDKDAVLSDVAEELRLSKIREKNLTEVSQKYMKENEELREKVAEKTKLVEMVRKGSKEYCEYGIAAEKMIQKMAKDIVNDRPVSPKDYEQYRLWAKGYRFNPQLPERTDEEEKKLNTAKSTLDDLKKKAYEFFSAKACNLGLVGSKDGNGIIDQMIGVDIAEEGGDLSGVFVLFGKDFIDALKKVKDVWQE